MSLLRTLSRVAFICNVCFLFTIVERYIPRLAEADPTTTLGQVLSFILTMGFILGAIVNILVNVILLVVFTFGRLRRMNIPAWLLVVNFIFFVVQLYFIKISWHHS